MAIECCNYNQNTDYHRVVDFLKKESLTNVNQLWDAGRMNFWRGSIHGGKKNEDAFFLNNVKMWTENNEVVGLCISEYGDEDMFIEVKAGYEKLYDAMLSWVNEWGKSKKRVRTFCFDDDEDKTFILNKHGYDFYKHDENRRYYNLLEADLEYDLPEGYTLVVYDEHPDVESRIAVVRSAFSYDGYKESNLKGLIGSDDYISELHLGILSPEGTYAAYCVGWITPSDDTVGYIEPVGTHKEHRRLGLAKAINKACFHRMRNRGVTMAMISSKAEPDVANYLYDALKPYKKRKIYEYVKA